MNATLSELERLRVENAELKAENAEWRRQYGGREELESAEWDRIHLARRCYGFRIGPARMLLELLRRRGRTVGKAALWRVAAVSQEADLKIVDVYISRLRRSVGPDRVETVFGYGYRIGVADAEAIEARLTATPDQFVNRFVGYGHD